MVLFIGAGISKLLGLPLWPELARRVLEDLVEKGMFNLNEIKDIKSSEPQQVLSIAGLFYGEKCIREEIAKHLQKPEQEGIYRNINNIGCVYVTTNYDELLAPHYSSRTGETQKPERTERVYAREKIRPSLLDKPGTVIHLHGCIDDPATMIVTIKDYLEHYDSDNIQEFLRHLFRKKVVVFLGYGLEEIEILKYIFRQVKIKKIEDGMN